MTDSLRVLLLEDSDEDATLVARVLRRERPDCDIRRVDGRLPFMDAMREFSPHLVLADHRMGDFSGMHALEHVLASAPDTPFIFVTGSLDEETAAECVKAGAWDYVIKDHLVRLGPAITSALALRRTRDDLQRSQDELRQTQKLDALGRLAGSVAHDYNNLMTAVLGFAFLVKESLPAADERQADLEEIRRAAERAAELTKQLLAFSRKQAIRLEAVALNEVITGVERLLGTLMGDRVVFDRQLADDLPMIKADAGQIEQVIVNLAVNARDAMPDGGILTIRTSRHAAGGRGSGSHVRLEVVDTGIGMDEATLDRIFEPFFTTKPRGQGTGLGLATAYGIVRQSNGEISVTSAPGRGTTFRVDFPVPAAPLEAAAAAAAAVPTTLAGTESVLIVEPDPVIRELARRVLGSYGYRVFESDSGRTARLVTGREAHLHLVVTTLMLPDGTGPELAAVIRRRHPDVCVIYLSGSADEDVAGTAIDGSDSAILHKPFPPAQLVQQVRERLNARRS